jgi:hypothetical protein
MASWIVISTVSMVFVVWAYQMLAESTKITEEALKTTEKAVRHSAKSDAKLREILSLCAKEGSCGEAGCTFVSTCSLLSVLAGDNVVATCEKGKPE